MAERSTDRSAGLLGMVWDLVASVGVYYALRLAGVDERPALLAGTILAATRLIWVAVRRRQVTWFAAVMLAVFGLGLLLTFLAGDARFLLLKDSIVTAGVGIVFLLSTLAGRPLTVSAAQTSQPWRAAAIDEMFRNRPDLRRRFVIPLVYTLSVDTMVGLSELMFWGTIGLLMVWSLFYTRAVWQTDSVKAAA